MDIRNISKIKEEVINIGFSMLPINLIKSNKEIMKEEMNVLFVCKCLPWSCMEGVKKQVWSKSCAMHAQGHQVTILCIGSEHDCENSYMKEGIVITEIPYFVGSYIDPIAMLAEEYFFNLAIKRWIRKNVEKFDVVHVLGQREDLSIKYRYSVLDEKQQA